MEDALAAAKREGAASGARTEALEEDVGRAREAQRTAEARAEQGDARLRRLSREAEDVRAEVGELKARLRDSDERARDARRLAQDNRALADRVHHLAAALERERAERAQWARARIELLSQFCAAGDGAPPAVEGLLRAAEASPPAPVPPPPPALE